MSSTDIELLELQALAFHSRMERIRKEVQSLFPEENIKLTLIPGLQNAAQNVHAKLFVALLNDIQNPNLITYLVNLQFDEPDGQSLTPLTMAAMTGNTTFVKTLLSHYEIDLERESEVIFDGLVVYGATALWVAAGMGHLQVVKLLVQSGADVNHNTHAQSSPLRAACYEGRLDIVKYLIEHGADVNLANTYNNTCIMIAAYKGHTDVVDTLLKNGADPNCQALCGATALHFAAECGHLEVCTLLLNHGARLQLNEHNLTPVLQAAERTHEEVVQMFIDRPGLLEKEEIITAIELLGASFANDKDNYNVSKAYMYLLCAMEMRYSDANNILRKRIMAPVPAYDNWLETENMLELQAIRLNHHSIHMEALTIRERILGKHNPELVQPIIYRGAVMADQARFTQCQILWNYAMDLRMLNNLPINRDLMRFAQLFSQILRMENQALCIETVLSVLTKCQQEIENNKYKLKHLGPKDVPRIILDQNDQNIVTSLYLIQIMAKIRQTNITEKQIEILYAIILRFIRCDTRMSQDQTLLHLAVNPFIYVHDYYSFDTYKFPCFRTALLLVHAGASVNALDNSWNTPLHTLIERLQHSSPHWWAAEAEKIVKLFVDAGAHLDAVNKDDLTAAQMCAHQKMKSILLSYQNANTTLKCVAARSIAVNHINYEGLVPKVLESFIETHSGRKFSKRG